jgi:two-component system LytT family sensor kinase
LLMILWNAIYFTYHFFRKSIHQELHNLQLVSSQNEIELKTLRSQLNPHFLFNALNSIRALIDIEPTKAKQSVTTLSNLLRSSLVLGKNEYISVKEELQIVQSYLELEKIRFEERLEIAWELDETCMHYLVPPFILQTQAENAIKHGISKLIEGGEIRIQTRLIDSLWLELNVINTGILGQSVDTGIGIENSKRRLDLQYGLNAFFELKQANNEVVCTIKIKL